MTALDKARAAYGATTTAVRSPRAIEYDAFARVTRGLIEAAKLDKTRFPELAQALHRNRELWTILAADVASPGNALPQDLRARLFYLSEFVHVHSAKVLRGEATSEALIDVNTAVMRGLRPAETAA